MEQRNVIENKVWDSDFFGLKIGYVEQDSFDQNDISIIQEKSTYDGLYLFASASIPAKILNPETTYYDQKITLEKRLNDESIDQKVDHIKLTEKHHDEVLPLCIEAGKHSRFKLDPNFSEDQFLGLYEMWCTNSLNGKFADLCIGIKNNEEILGLLTLKFSEEIAHIGLIAVSPTSQGQGIGSKLLNLAEVYSLKNNCNVIHVPTQSINQQALSFYEKNGFNRKKVEHIYHIWRR